MGIVSGGGIHSTKSVTVAAQSVQCISVVVSVETGPFTTTTRVGCATLPALLFTGQQFTNCGKKFTT